MHKLTLLNKELYNQIQSKSIPELITKAPWNKIKDLGEDLEVVQSIDIRGFGDTATSNTLILINGQRLTNIDLMLVDFQLFLEIALIE